MKELKQACEKVEKKVEVVHIPEPEPDPIMHSDIHSILEIMDAFKPEERPKVLDNLLDFTYSKE